MYPTGTHMSERIVMARLKGQSNNMTILSVYVPIRDAPDHLKDRLYDDLQLTLNKITRKDILVISGEFNASISMRLNNSEWAIGNHDLTVVTELDSHVCYAE